MRWCEFERWPQQIKPMGHAMNVMSLEYLEYPASRPPVMGLYVCKVACEATVDFRFREIYMWGEWTGEDFDFGDRWDLRLDERAKVLAFAYHPEHSRIHRGVLTQTDWKG